MASLQDQQVDKLKLDFTQSTATATLTRSSADANVEVSFTPPPDSEAQTWVGIGVGDGSTTLMNKDWYYQAKAGFGSTNGFTWEGKYFPSGSGSFEIICAINNAAKVPCSRITVGISEQEQTVASRVEAMIKSLADQDGNISFDAINAVYYTLIKKEGDDDYDADKATKAWFGTHTTLKAEALINGDGGDFYRTEDEGRLKMLEDFEQAAVAYCSSDRQALCASARRARFIDRGILEEGASLQQELLVLRVEATFKSLQDQDGKISVDTLVAVFTLLQLPAELLAEAPEGFTWDPEKEAKHVFGDHKTKDWDMLNAASDLAGEFRDEDGKAFFECFERAAAAYCCKSRR